MSVNINTIKDIKKNNFKLLQESGVFYRRDILMDKVLQPLLSVQFETLDFEKKVKPD